MKIDDIHCSDDLINYCINDGGSIVEIIDNNEIIINNDTGTLYIATLESLLHFLPDELGAKTVFDIGDKVTHKQYGGEYTVVALPYIDSRSIGRKSEYTASELLNLVYYGNCLWVEDKNGIGEPESGPDGLSADLCYYKNFEKI